MPAERKESPSSQSLGSNTSNKTAGTRGSSNEGTPVKASMKKEDPNNESSPGSQNEKSAALPGRDSATANSGKRASLPAVKKAFKGPDSPGSSRTDKSRQTLNPPQSRMSVVSYSSGYKSSNDFGSQFAMTSRPEEEIYFVTSLQREHECPVCSQVLRYPVQFECKHHCCSGCLPEILRVEPRCPVDNSRIDRDKVILNKNLQREIEGIPVLCTYHERGCMWSETLRDLMPHLEECAYATIACPNGCDAEFQRRFAQKHSAEDCPCRRILCPYCQTQLLVQDEELHLEDCVRLPVACRNGCPEKEIPRQDVQEHMDTICPKQHIPCSFSGIGCNHEGMRADMTDHNKTNAEQHMALVAGALTNFGRTYDQQAFTLQNQTDKLAKIEGRLEGLEKLYGAQCVWKLDNFTSRREEARAGKKTTIYSPPFLTHRHGYKMIVSTCLNGDGKARGKSMSIFVCICRGEFDSLLSWPFNHRVTFTLVDQCQDPAGRRNITYSIKPNICKENKAFLQRPTAERNASFGSQKFVELELLDTRDYVRDDIMFIKVVVDSEDTDVL